MGSGQQCFGEAWKNTREDALTVSLRENACWHLCSLLPPIENSVKKGRATEEMEAHKAGLAAPTRQGKRVKVCYVDVGSCPAALQGGC